MIRIAVEHIYVLRNSTGKPFTELIDRLVRSSAATFGISPAAVLDNPRVNYPRRRRRHTSHPSQRFRPIRLFQSCDRLAVQGRRIEGLY